MNASPRSGVHRKQPGVFCAALAVANICLQLVSSAAQDLQHDEQQAIARAVDAVQAAVVQVELVGDTTSGAQAVLGSGPTTGTLVDSDGYVVTSRYRFAQQPAAVFVRTADGTRHVADIVAHDYGRNLVLLKIQLTAPISPLLPVARDQMRVGQRAIAVGRTFDIQTPNVSVGILSARNRIWSRAVQTDAKTSPTNFGGPLIDARGRVFGILAPLSPLEEGDQAGMQWYDSGIGFAVPLEDILANLTRWKTGEDIFPGRLGASFRGNDIYQDEPVVAVCPGNSPAARAGVRPGDKIVKVDQRDVQNQAQLKHALGPRNAGERISLTIQRDNTVFETQLQLAARIEPFRMPWIGVLPDRNSDDDAVPGVSVRHVIPSSPAEQSGIQPGDLIRQIDRREVHNRDAIVAQLAQHEVGDSISISIIRGNQEIAVTVELETNTGQTTDPLPPVVDSSAAARNAANAFQVILPEETNRADAWMPPGYRHEYPHGLLVWLAEPGTHDSQQLLASWIPWCAQRQVIMLVVQSTDSQRWNPGEVDIVMKYVEKLRSEFTIDDSRIAIGGQQAGGVMASLIALRARDTFSGLALVDAAATERLESLVADSIDPLTVLCLAGSASTEWEQYQASIDRMRKAGFAAHLEDVDPSAVDVWCPWVVRWVDSLDQF